MDWTKSLEKKHAEATRVAREFNETREALIVAITERLQALGVPDNMSTVPAPAGAPYAPGLPCPPVHTGTARLLIANAAEIRALLEPFDLSEPAAAEAPRRGPGRPRGAK